MELVLERRFSRGLQARVGYTYSHLMNNGDRDRAGKRRPQRRRSEPGRSAAMDSERRRHAARAADRVHLGDPRSHRRGDEARARWLEPERHPALRERPADDHQHDQRPWRAAVQHAEAAEPGRRGHGGLRRLRSVHGSLLQPRRLGRSGAAPVRERARTRRRGARVRELQRGHQHLQGVPVQRPEEAPVRSPDRQPVQPHDLLQPGIQLERRELRAGVHAVQHRALRFSSGSGSTSSS